MAQVIFDASDLEQLGRAFTLLPGRIEVHAMASAMRRMRDMAKTQVIRLDAKRVKMPVNKVRQVTSAYFNAGGNSLGVVINSGWWPLYHLGARRTKAGVTIKGRGSFAHAFIAEMKSGHKGVFRRIPGTFMIKDGRRQMIRELFGPNPAHDVTNNPDEYLRLLATLIEDNLAPRVLHEIARLLPR